MRYIKLTTICDRDLGELGLALPDSEFSCTSGALLAHDVIEHQGGGEGIGGTCDELEALGAMWYVRGQFEDITRDNRNMHSAAEHLSSDLLQMAIKYVYGEPLELVSRDTRPHIFDDSFAEGMRLAHRDLPHEVERDQIAAVNMVYFWHRCLGHLRTGARKAHKRFRSAGAANSMFWNIANAFPKLMVTPYHKQWMSSPPNSPFEREGEVWKLAYDRNQATIEISYDEEDY